MEVSHRHTLDNRGRGIDIEQAKKAIGSATLGRIRVAGPREESNRLQGDSLISHGKFPNNEVVSDLNPSSKMRSFAMLQGRHNENFEIHDSVDAGLGGIQGHTKEIGIEHDGDSTNDA